MDLFRAFPSQETVKPRALLQEMGWEELARERLVRIIADQETGWKNRSPLVTAQMEGTQFSISLLCENKPWISTFFYSLLTQGLLPERKLHPLHFMSSALSEEGEGASFLLVEMVLDMSVQDKKQCMDNFFLLEKELLLGISSEEYAAKILETKALFFEGKAAVLQALLSRLIKKQPLDFSEDIFVLMQKVVMGFSSSFQKTSHIKHLCRLIVRMYLLCKKIEKEKEKDFKRRYLHHKIFRIRKQTFLGERTVLGILIVLHLSEEGELFEKKQYDGLPIFAYEGEALTNALHLSYDFPAEDLFVKGFISVEMTKNRSGIAKLSDESQNSYLKGGLSIGLVF